LYTTPTKRRSAWRSLARQNARSRLLDLEAAILQLPQSVCLTLTDLVEPRGAFPEIRP
jgi:hypothetical protein